MESNLVRVLKTLSDETRLRILNLLQFGVLCVCELEILLDISQSNASRHLNKLTSVGLVEYYKAAKYVYYKLNDDITGEYPFIKEILVTETKKLDKYQEDNRRLTKYKDDGYTCDELKDGKVCFED
ncbi:ArsR/SmtB family transcription factor [Natranaerobius trueperi]|uniref:Transcriptional regulator n=1 Tax=Natranaerobius trueperi TaxID=759412 RepID=A0A226C1M3_9FIRM|nr:metalloregulator ArsR/SmtB family transcription factor [Natranaerobius trueperi]OWZ84317.1 transcriptional regulator [Natranaerobius trueperi]